jgi:hypothetical protein
MIKRNFTAALIAAGMLTVASLAQAIVVDLGSDGSGTINGAIFQTNDDHPTGTGVYNPFLTVQNKGWEQGYNSGSNNNFDTKRVPQWNHEIQFSDLQATVINGVQYIGFSVDINESNSQPLISLDALRVYISPTLQTSTSTDGNGFFNGSLGTLVYDLGGNQVIYNDQNTGSGGGDINIYIPVSAFLNAGVQADDYIYMYQRWGNTDSTDGGFEETALIRGLTPVPEMSALFPIVGLLVAVGSTHILRRRRMAKVSS